VPVETRLIIAANITCLAISYPIFRPIAYISPAPFHESNGDKLVCFPFHIYGPSVESLFPYVGVLNLACEESRRAFPGRRAEIDEKHPSSRIVATRRSDLFAEDVELSAAA
jgi:hypothetical protein